MKLLTTLLIAALAALAVYSARRRIFFALKTGAIVYVVVLFARLALEGFGNLSDRWDDVVWPVFLLLVAWAVLWFASTRYEARKRRDRSGASASAAVRPARSVRPRLRP